MFLYKQKTENEMRISDWSSDVCSSDLILYALGHLTAEGVEDVRILLCQLAKLRIAQFGNFAFGLCADPGAAFLFRPFFLEKPHLSEKVACIQIGDDHLATVVILDKNGDRTFDDEKKRLATVACVNDRALSRVSPSMAMGEQLVDILYLGRKRDS